MMGRILLITLSWYCIYEKSSLQKCRLPAVIKTQNVLTGRLVGCVLFKAYAHRNIFSAIHVKIATNH